MYVNCKLININQNLFKIIKHVSNIMIPKIFNVAIYNYGKTQKSKIKTAYQRVKYYQRFPHIFKRKTLIRPPDLTAPQIQFPINVPIRIRHLKIPTKPIYQQNSANIHWNRLSPNQILLGLQNVQYLTWQQLVEGLDCLSKAKGQQNHNWNEHEWVKGAFDSFLKQSGKIKKEQFIKFYHLMKKLGNNNQQLWKMIYEKIQLYIYDLNSGDLQMLIMRYYDKPSEYFSPSFKQKLIKMSEGRIRMFRRETILKLFDIYLNQNRLNTFYIQSYFVPLFKDQKYQWTNEDIGKILRYMMIIEHQHNERLYSGIYQRIRSTEFKQQNEVDFLLEVIEQVQQIFTSHRVEDVISHLKEEKKNVKQRISVVKKTLHEIVKQDLIYFMEKRKLKTESVA